MISTFTAFFDANVFYGARLRSLVAYAAQTKLFRARWSDRVHDEWVRNLVANRLELKAGDLRRTRDLMNAAVPDCLVTGFEPLIGAIVLPDENDRHVVAAAIVARASVIVTFNRSDFPKQQLDPFGIEAIHPDDFLVDSFGLSPDAMAEAVINDVLHYSRPPLSFASYRDSLARAGVPHFAALIEPLGVLVPAAGDRDG